MIFNLARKTPNPNERMKQKDREKPKANEILS
jgi:hypothetical protein